MFLIMKHIHYKCISSYKSCFVKIAFQLATEQQQHCTGGKYLFQIEYPLTLTQLKQLLMEKKNYESRNQFSVDRHKRSIDLT